MPKPISFGNLDLTPQEYLILHIECGCSIGHIFLEERSYDVPGIFEDNQGPNPVM